MPFSCTHAQHVGACHLLATSKRGTVAAGHHFDVLCEADGVEAIISMGAKPLDVLLGGHVLGQGGFTQQQNSRAKLAPLWWPVWDCPAPECDVQTPAAMGTLAETLG